MSDADRFHAEPPPPPQGSSTGSKILFGCAIGCGVLFLLCCGGLVGTTWLGYKMLDNAVFRDPAKIEEVAAEVGTIDVPAALHPKAAFDVRLPIIDRTFVKAVVYTDEPQDQILAIGEFSESFASVDEKQLRDQIDRALNDSDHHDGDDDFRVDETHTREIEIRGKPAQFRIEQGENKSGHKRIRAMGQFEGHHGVGLLYLQLDGEENKLEEVEKILNSIR